MGRVSDTIGTINTTLRTLVMLAVVGAAGIVGYKAYELYHEPRQTLAGKQAQLDDALSELQRTEEELAARRLEIERLSSEVAEKSAQIERLEVAMQFLKVTQRLAQLTVIDQRELPPEEADEAANGPSRPNLVSRIEFVEITPGGDPIGEAKQFDIAGDMVYIDYLQATFDDKYVEEADIDRSTAIALFRRIFGEHQEPADGFQIDTVGTRPIAYARGKELSDFERKIWDDFWLIANDRKRAAELGIHAAHGSAVSMRVRPGMTYEIDLRATGPMTIRPLESIE